MPGRMVRPKGTRVTVHIPANIATIAVNSPGARIGLARKGEEIEVGAQRDCPVGTEPLAHGRSVRLKDTFVKETQITPTGPVLLVGYMAFWAHFVHNGTVKLPANPWLLNAVLDTLVTGRGAATRAA